MSEQDSVIDAPLTDTPAETVAAEPQADAADDTQQTTDTTDSAADEGAENEPAELPKGIKKRIDTLTRQRYERDARIAELEAQLAAAKPQPKEPQPQDFADLETYLEAKAEHIANQRLSQTQQAATQEAIVQEKAQNFNQRAAEFRQSAPDFDQAIAAVPAVLMKPDMVEVILDIDEGPQVAYHLATNLHECARIASLSGRQQALEIGKLAARLAAKPEPKRISAAPEPVKPIKATGSTQKRPEDMTMDEYAKWRNAQLQKQRR